MSQDRSMEQFGQLPMQPSLARCPHCITETQVKIHSHKDRRCRCCTCQRTFSERHGTPLFHLRYPLPIVMVVLALLSHGCPLAAIVFAFGIDERTVASWQARAGDHARRVQYQYAYRSTIQLAQEIVCHQRPQQTRPPQARPLAETEHCASDQTL